MIATTATAIPTPLGVFQQKLGIDSQHLATVRKSVGGLLNPRMDMWPHDSGTRIQADLAGKAGKAYLDEYGLTGSHDKAAIAARSVNPDGRGRPQLGIEYAVENCRRAFGLPGTTTWWTEARKNWRIEWEAAKAAAKAKQVAAVRARKTTPGGARVPQRKSRAARQA